MGPVYQGEEWLSWLNDQSWTLRTSLHRLLSKEPKVGERLPPGLASKGEVRTRAEMGMMFSMGSMWMQNTTGGMVREFSAMLRPDPTSLRFCPGYPSLLGLFGVSSSVPHPGDSLLTTPCWMGFDGSMQRMFLLMIFYWWFFKCFEYKFLSSLGPLEQWEILFIFKSSDQDEHEPLMWTTIKHTLKLPSIYLFLFKKLKF